MLPTVEELIAESKELDSQEHMLRCFRRNFNLTFNSKYWD